MVSRDNIRAFPLAFWEGYLSFAKNNSALGLGESEVTKLIEHMWPFLMTRGTWAMDGTFGLSEDEELCAVMTVPCPLPDKPFFPLESGAAVKGSNHRGVYPCGTSAGVKTALAVANNGTAAGPMRAWSGRIKQQSGAQ
jgi:hypothetical protein